MKSKILTFLLLLFILFRFGDSLYFQKEKFFSPGYSLRYESLRSTYYSSQYVKKTNPTIMLDETLEAFAGGVFLNGLNPILITHDHPPLGRYIISLSILLFDNENTIMVPLLIISLLGIYLIGRSIFNNNFLSLIPVALFANEPLFVNKFSYSPLLEPIQLPFIIFALYFFIKAVSTHRYIIYFPLTSLMLGFVISTRFFVLGAFLLLSMILYFVLSDRNISKRLVYFLLTLPVSLLVLLFSYIRTIQLGSSVFHVFGIQKYILFYHKSKFILPFSFWDLILFNRWHTWWGNWGISSDPQWIIVWPIAIIGTFVLFILWILRKVTLSVPEKILFIWVGLYCMMLSTGYTSTRYFLPLLPFLYILLIACIIKCINKIKLKTLMTRLKNK